PDALGGVHVDDAVLVLDDRSRRGTGGEAARVLAVHALVLAHQPGEAVVGLLLLEADEVPVVGVQGGQRLVRARLLGGDHRQVVPLLTGHLAGLAADAGGGVDQLGDDREPAERRAVSALGGRGAPDLHRLTEGWGAHARSAFPTFSMRTRKALNSGVQVLGSIAEGVMKLASGPRCAGIPA